MFNVDDKFINESHSFILNASYCRQKPNIALCRVILKRYINYKSQLLIITNLMQRKKKKYDLYTSLVTRHNVCRVLSKILKVNFDQLQIPVMSRDSKSCNDMAVI